MIVYGLIGHPLGHSFSKAYFTAKFEREGLDCRYENFDLLAVEEVTELFHSHTEIMGCNVTAPYKEKILDYIDDYDAIVAEIKSVNTLKRMPDGRIVGFNTDVVGFDTLFERAFQERTPQQASLSDVSALVLGTGGASKAVQYVLRQRGIPYQLVSRNPLKGDYVYGTTGALLTPEVIKDHALIINTTPLGTYPDIEAAPALPYDAITSGHLLIDLIYNPEETRFLREGRLRGAHTCNGLTMLHSQAEASWQIWQTEQPSPQQSKTR